MRMDTRKKPNNDSECENTLEYLEKARKINCTIIAYEDLNPDPTKYPPSFFFYPYNKNKCNEILTQYRRTLNKCNPEEHLKFKQNKRP